jgi:o-succinylbenzoate synthase
MLRADYTKHILQFKLPAGTSRGTMHHKEAWFLKVWEENNPSVSGLGECAVFKGLSYDDSPEYEFKLQGCCQHIHDSERLNTELREWPSMRFGVETALLDLKHGGNHFIFPSAFTAGRDSIPINGLIWMGDPSFMKQQIKNKLEAGFRCLKFKVGAIQLAEELELLRLVRKEFGKDDMEIRLDANGAFSRSDVFTALDKFSEFTIHSIEQPVKAGNRELLAEVCNVSPIPVALDEELIGLNTVDEKRKLLQEVTPKYMIIKPALTGGFSGAQEWIEEAKARKIGWWITSALESNIGLNAIAQWTYSLGVNVTQGLGTGSLYTNNIPSPLIIRGQQLCFDHSLEWDTSNLHFHDR